VRVCVLFVGSVVFCVWCSVLCVVFGVVRVDLYVVWYVLGVLCLVYFVWGVVCVVCVCCV
jgi:hypothetical protein